LKNMNNIIYRKVGISKKRSFIFEFSFLVKK